MQAQIPQSKLTIINRKITTPRLRGSSGRCSAQHRFFNDIGGQIVGDLADARVFNEKGTKRAVHYAFPLDKIIPASLGTQA